MLSESDLKRIEARESSSDLFGQPYVALWPAELEQLIAAARVANAIALAEQSERDAALSDRTGGDAVLSRLARADLARALRFYTAKPAEAIK